MKQEFKGGKNLKAWIVVLAAILMLAATTAQAQTATKDSDAWKYEFALIVWGSGMSATIGPTYIKTVQVNASFGDLLNYLDMAAMGSFSARKNRWGFLVDTLYVNLGHSVDNRYGYPIKLNVEDAIIGAQGTYRVIDTPKATFDWVFGARYNEVKVGLTPKYFPNQGRSLSWTDPVFGVLGTAKMSPRWTFGYRADIGGFSAGSQYTWLGVLRFDGQMSKHTAIDFGYMGYSVNYTAGSGVKEFIYHSTLYGPFVGMAFRW